MPTAVQFVAGTAAAFLVVQLVLIGKRLLTLLHLLRAGHPWPGPPSLADRQEQIFRMQRGLQPTRLFPDFLRNLVGIAGTLVMLIVMMVFAAPLTAEPGWRRWAILVFFVPIHLYAGGLWVSRSVRTARQIDALVRGRP